MELYTILPVSYIKSAKKGVLSAIIWKSSIVSSISAARAIANKWSTWGNMRTWTRRPAKEMSALQHSSSLQEYWWLLSHLRRNYGLKYLWKGGLWIQQFGSRTRRFSRTLALSPMLVDSSYISRLEYTLAPSLNVWIRTGQKDNCADIYQGTTQACWKNRARTCQVPWHSLKTVHDAAFVKLTSRAELIVLAVNIPPQAPAPGQPWRTTSNRSSSLILPTAKAPANVLDHLLTIK